MAPSSSIQPAQSERDTPPSSRNGLDSDRTTGSNPKSSISSANQGMGETEIARNRLLSEFLPAATYSLHEFRRVAEALTECEKQSLDGSRNDTERQEAETELPILLKEYKRTAHYLCTSIKRVEQLEGGHYRSLYKDNIISGDDAGILCLLAQRDGGKDNKFTWCDLKREYEKAMSVKSGEPPSDSESDDE